IDKGGFGTVFVVDGRKRFYGVVTDGDIRRAILKGVNIEKPIGEITNKKPIVVKGKIEREELAKLKNREDIKEMTLNNYSLKIPVVDRKERVKDVIFVHANRKNPVYSLMTKQKFDKGTVKKILLVGGAGYLGSVLCRKLLNRRYKVRVLDNLTYGDEGIKALYKNKNFEFFKGDIRNISDLVEAIKGMDAVIHLAAIVGDPACAVDSEETLEINYLATKTITETCKYLQINRFIFASTCSVYGQNSSSDQKLAEESPLNPVSLYAETKIKCEKSILEAADENFSPTILRMATLYGYSPLMRFDLAINFLTAGALFNKKITIFGGNQWRPWLHLEDTAQAYIACLEAPIEKVGGTIFNLLSENYKIIEVGNIINSICPGVKIEISKKITDKRSYNVSFNKISRVLNYQPKKKIIDGVTEIKNVIKRGLIRDYKDPKYRITLPQI
ncbi:MAG: NAD-dependent epimerase/dehydratase, partial [Candidatus Berkelbacteria bacterium Licking1014_85]